MYEALSHPARRDIVALLRDADRTPGELAGLLRMPKPTLTGHLNVLKSAGLLDAERNGTSITYSLRTSVLEDAMVALMKRFKVGGQR